MRTATRGIDLLAAAALAASAAAQGTLTESSSANAPVAPGGIIAEGSLGRVRKLLDVAYPMAREWSPGAKLYSIYGRAPRNKDRWESEQWGFIFGDPDLKDGSFHVIFEGGAIRTRQGVKGGVKMVDQFKDGHFQNRDTDLSGDYNNSDYARCRPVDPKFADTAALEHVILKYKLLADSLGQYNFSLFRPYNDECDGLGRHSLFLSDKPIPLRLMKRSLWVIHAPAEVLYIDAKTGKVVFRRKRGQ